ncbi:MAG TPA: hypothetical protein VN688_00790 [Gemmataceae bacterium]|nr:hypothetical protein [Gemmataceae bacterium]
MAIKTDADVAYFSKRPEERQLAALLHEAFDVTFGNAHGQLAFWLADPQKHTRERFGLQKEVLVVYSPHVSTDARVLTAVENISRHPDFRHRVDKVLSVLIHKGDPEAAEQLVREATDRIIVSIHVDELLNPQRGSLFFRSKLAQQIGAIDLFGMSSPITSDKYFFGRDDLVQVLTNRSVVSKGNSGLFGLRKTGKTSILFAIQRRLEGRPVLAEFVDCQNPGVHAARWWQVLENLVFRLGEALKRDFKRDAKLQEGYNQANAGIRFSSDIQAILKYGNLENTILMLDEIEYITPRLSGKLGTHWDEDFVPFWQTIRSTHQESKGGFTFLVAGVNPTCVERSHFDSIVNPIFQLAIPHFLEPLKTTNIREMVRSIGRYAGLQFEESACTHLQERYGGHPYLIRLACSEVFQASDRTNPEKLVRVENVDFKRLSSDIRVRLANPIRDILLSLVWWYPEEYDLLRILADGDAEFVNSYLQVNPDSFVQFARYGVLREGSGEFAIDDLKVFLKERGEAYKKELSPFTRGDMPPELLPEVPDLELLGKLFEKRTEIETKLRKAIILYLGVKHNWNAGLVANSIVKGLAKRPDRQSPKDLFVGRSPQDVMTELYTLDLKSIMLENWETFGPLFDGQKSRFEMNLDTLNRARRVDAHTKPLTENERVDFENSYGWLLNRLAKVP